MAITYFPFDAGSGANVLESSWRDMAREWLASGVMVGRGNELAVTADSSGMEVHVATGWAWIEGHLMESSAIEDVALSNGDATNPRWDRIVAQVDFSANTMTITSVEGTPAASPAVPALTQSGSTWQISLARVYVPATDTVVSADQVRDERTFTSNRHRLDIYNVHQLS